MIVKVLGSGCPKCKVLYNNVNSAIRELEIEAEVIKVEDMQDILAYNVMSTPALVINEKVVATGQLKYKKVREIINNG